MTAFSGNGLLRESEKREDDSAASALDHPSARLLLISENRLLVDVADKAFEPYFSRRQAAAFGASEADAVLLGLRETAPVLALPVGADVSVLPADIKAIDFRSIYMQGLLSPSALGELSQAAALLSWHRNHRYCGICGNETRIRSGGLRRDCMNCRREHFPRTDPVAIMLAMRDGHCLLGRSPHFNEGMYSCLAGFIEPGETIEEAVRRETMEEAGIEIGRVAYQASQPWPFPYSLMIGCYAQALTVDIDADLEELEDCRWFDRAEIVAMIDGRHPHGYRIPPRGAIASVLIRNWAGHGLAQKSD